MSFRSHTHTHVRAHKHTHAHSHTNIHIHHFLETCSLHIKFPLVKLKILHPEFFLSDSLQCKDYYAHYPLLFCTGKYNTGSVLTNKKATNFIL